MTRLHRRRQRGQSIVELSLLVPVVLLLFMGVYTAGSFISDMDLAGQAVRAGARVGAEVGDYGYPNNPTTEPSGTTGANLWACVSNTSPSNNTNPCVVDNNIIASVVTVARNLTNVGSVDEIDIYDPCAQSGLSCGSSTELCSPSSSSNVAYGTYYSGDPVDVYTPSLGPWTASSNWALSGSYGYTLDKREQMHPNENVIGVRLLFHFKAAAPFTFFNVQASQFATMCLAPIESGG